MDARMFDGIFQALIVFGIAIGFVVAAALLGIYWLFTHLSITWH